MKLPPEFDAEVYALVERIPAGRVTTYGRIARLVGFPDHARRVGRALATAPEGIPCHRVVDAAGRTVAGWSAQREMLEREGIRFRPDGRAILAGVLWPEFDDAYDRT